MANTLQALYTDKDLLERIQQDDKKALEILFKTYYSPLCRFAKTILKNAEQAEDVVQEVFLKIWDKRNSIEPNPSFKAYLYMAVRNHSLNLLKLNERKYWLDDEMENDAIFSNNEVQANLEAKELNQRINEAIESLPEKCKLTFKLSRFENLSYKEIAEAMNLSVKTVENQMGKALALLRKEVVPFLGLLVVCYKFLFN
jgi:RNA polymerase sigma-70 factor (ECF subfamily)